MDGTYRKIIVQSCSHSGGGSSSKVRCRPIAGQGLPTDMFVECSKKMRMAHPVGTLFEIQAKVTDREGGNHFVYTSSQWEYRVVPENEIIIF
jgi:hypothetical protein